MIEQPLAQLSTLFFVVALLHTLAAPRFAALAVRAPSGSMRENLLHFLSEVEIIFGFWAFVFIATIAMMRGTSFAAHVMQQQNFGEALFVFTIMCVAATKPIADAAERLLDGLIALIPAPRLIATYAVALIIGPLLGSLITEPAAMTILALYLKERLFTHDVSERFKYATLALLFINVSIGGTLTHFAAPPIIMVAASWGWDLRHVFLHFGLKAMLCVTLSTLGTLVIFRKTLLTLSRSHVKPAPQRTIQRAPLWIIAVHIATMVLIITYHHYVSFFLPLFLIFLGFCEVSAMHQSPLQIRQSLLVGFFLSGLIVLGSFQSYWIAPLFAQASAGLLFLSALLLSAVTDNAAVTYLGTLAGNLSASGRYGLVAGAVTGGGLTVLANAANPIGYNILRSTFTNDSILAGRLFKAALPYTLLAMIIFGAFL